MQGSADWCSHARPTPLHPCSMPGSPPGSPSLLVRGCYDPALTAPPVAAGASSTYAAVATAVLTGLGVLVGVWLGHTTRTAVQNGHVPGPGSLRHVMSPSAHPIGTHGRSMTGPVWAALPPFAHSRSLRAPRSVTALPSSGADDGVEYPILAAEALMAPKAHGTTERMVQPNLRWGCDRELADRICSFNRRYAERWGYWESTGFAQEAAWGDEITFYDSVSGRPLFVAPRGRAMAEFLAESEGHGWPSFRDEEVVWANVRVIPSGKHGEGEAVSVDGTHLGHNIPDGQGNRYCINLVAVAGRPEE